MEQTESTSNRRLLLAGLGLAGAAALARVAKAGPLTPPPGPISSTGKSVAELSTKISPFDLGRAEPRRPITDCPSSSSAMFVISQPGAYYLTGNIDAQQGKSCISVECDHVDLDGGGFTINGVQGMQAAITGGVQSPPRRCVEVYDMAFRSCSGGACIEMSSCSNCFVSDCLFDSCVCPGDATGPGAVCRLGSGGEVCDSDVRDCDGAAISVGDGSNIEGCTCMGGSGGAYRCTFNCCCDNCMVVSHSGIGFSCDDGCTLCDFECRSCPGGAPAAVMGSSCVMECCVSDSSGGFVCLDDCDCDDCDVTRCTGTGLACRDRCSVSSFKFSQVSGAAVRGGRSMSMDSCDLTSCADGVACGDNSSITDCCARQIGTQGTPGGVGIQCGSNCSVTDTDCHTCVTGMNCGSGTCMERCVCAVCSDGYVCASDCRLTECDALSCTGIGVTCADRCSLTDMEVRSCGGVSCAMGSGCCVDRCSCMDGGSHAFYCLSDCAFSDCDVARCNGWAMTCAIQAMSVYECRCVSCWGLDCPAGSCITENELTSCDGGASTGVAGGAITCRGPRQTVSQNSCIDCGIGILIFGGCDGTCCESNEMSGCSTAGMVVQSTGCLCSDNSCSARPPGATGFDFGPCAFGPIVDCSQGGDVSLNTVSAHHCTNWLY